MHFQLYQMIVFLQVQRGKSRITIGEHAYIYINYYRKFLRISVLWWWWLISSDWLRFNIFYMCILDRQFGQTTSFAGVCNLNILCIFFILSKKHLFHLKALENTNEYLPSATLDGIGGLFPCPVSVLDEAICDKFFLT